MQAADSLESRRQALQKTLADEWEYELRESPEMATVYGDYRYNDKWSDMSLAHVAQQLKDAHAYLDRFNAIDTNGFPEQEQINKQLMVEKYQDSIKGITLKNYLQPVDQFNGIQIALPQLTAMVPADSVKHYEDYLTRLRTIPHVLEQATAVLKEGEKEKLLPPKYLLEKTVVQCESIANAAGAASSFADPVKQFPTAIPAADQKRLRTEILNAIDHDVRPAYTKFAHFIKTDYAPKL